MTTYTRKYFINLFTSVDERRLNGRTNCISKIDGTQSIEGFLGGYESKRYKALRALLGFEPYALAADMGYMFYKHVGLTTRERVLHFLTNKA